MSTKTIPGQSMIYQLWSNVK